MAEQKLWWELDRETLQEGCRKVKDWVMDSGTNVGRLSLYEQIVSLSNLQNIMSTIGEMTQPKLHLATLKMHYL